MKNNFLLLTIFVGVLALPGCAADGLALPSLLQGLAIGLNSSLRTEPPPETGTQQSAQQSGTLVSLSDTTIPPLYSSAADATNTGLETRGFDAQQVAWQQESLTGSGSRDPGNRELMQQEILRQDAELLGEPNEIYAMQQKRLRTVPQPQFGAEEIRVIPKTATERVIELNRVVADLQKKNQDLQDQVGVLKHQKSTVLATNQQMQEHIERLEKKITTMRQESIQASQRYAEITRRIQMFSSSRQKQISDLSALVDQLEQQLRQRDLPATNRHSASSQSVPTSAGSALAIPPLQGSGGK